MAKEFTNLSANEALELIRKGVAEQEIIKVCSQIIEDSKLDGNYFLAKQASDLMERPLTKDELYAIKDAAIRTGKYSYAAQADGGAVDIKIDGKDDIEAKSKNLDSLAKNAVKFAEIKNAPVGNNHQYIYMELQIILNQTDSHQDDPYQDLIELGIDYLIGNSDIAEKTKKGLTTPQRIGLLKALVDYYNEREKHFVKQLKGQYDIERKPFKIAYTEALEDFIDAVNDFGDGKIGRTDYRDRLSLIQKNLLGRETGADQAWQYLKELNTNNPAYALFLGAMGEDSTNAVLIPRLDRSKNNVRAVAEVLGIIKPKNTLKYF